jgi:hypothetical protein
MRQTGGGKAEGLMARERYNEQLEISNEQWKIFGEGR